MNPITHAALPTTDRQHAGSIATLLPFACLYASFGVTLGLIGGGAPLVLRARGLPLEATGLLQLVFLPIGISFLWAPLIDRVRLPGLPHRIGWIVAAQALTMLLLLLLAVIGRGPVTLLFTLALMISMAQATMDVALEALVVETVPREKRPPVTTAKLCGSSLGTMLGISLATMFAATLTLPLALTAAALLDALLLLPILFYPETTRRSVGHPARRPRPTWRREHGVRALAIGVYFGSSLMLGSVTSMALLDLKVPLPTTGLVTGGFGTLVGVAATLLSGALMMRSSAFPIIVVCAGGVAAGGALFSVAAAFGLPGVGIAAALLLVLFEAAIGVPVFNMLYRWAEGESAATDYALLFGAAFLVSFPVRVASPTVAAALGWPGYFALSVIVYIIAVAALLVAMRRPTPSPVGPLAA